MSNETAYIQIGVWLTVNQPTVMREILTETYPIPSLDGKGKMSKSKGEKTVITLTETKEHIKKKIGRIPSNEKGFPVFFALHWLTLTKVQKNDLALRIGKEVGTFL